MKKEYLILIVLILILSAYLFLHKENKDNYTLPQIEKMDVAEITGLILEKKDGPIRFTKKDKNWILTDKEFPADAASVQNMLDTLKTFKLSALVAQTGDLKRYDLDDENHIQVKAMKGENTLFEFTMGKTAPSFNHTFVMVTQDKNIYHANGNFRSNFDKTMADFRDKKVLEFKQDSIKRFTIEKDRLSRTLVSKEMKDEKGAASITWSAGDGSPADKEAISDLLASVSFMECEKFLEDAEKKELENEKPLCKIHLENEGPLELTLFKTGKEDRVSGVSSMSKEAFTLTQFNGKQILSNIEKLLGIPENKE